MALQSLTNQQFTCRFKAAVAEERQITAKVLRYFREAERRMLYAEAGYPSLLDFAVRELKYSEAAAGRRIAAMRLLREVPQIEAKVQSGDLSLSTLTKAATFFRQSEKQCDMKITLAEKLETLTSLENLSARKVDRLLVEKCPELKPVKPERRRAVAGGGTQVSTVFDQATLQMLEEIQDLLGKKLEVKDLVRYLAMEQLKVLRKKRRGQSCEDAVMRGAQSTSDVKPNMKSDVEPNVKPTDAQLRQLPQSTRSSNKDAVPSTQPVKQKHKRRPDRKSTRLNSS